MDCTLCKNRICREGEKCAIVSFDNDEVLARYQQEQPIVQAAARLVDNGRAGTLPRLMEIVELAHLLKMQKLALAYCYGMENDARSVAQYLRKEGFTVEAASCTVGGLAQNQINTESNNCKVACNPIGQALQLNQRQPDLVITMGLCLGHDLLFQRNIKTDTTTLLVKDRVHQHQPLLALESIKN
ncbi:DUF1847 domain-containing protein [Roseimarinus sediminis]|uniref:DUF1847 domain-containing protein n=1 Tax=Roseimarinus sediminis TaxID=1610899 RepID=UPI003D22D844